MKKLFSLVSIAALVFTTFKTSAQSANTSLSNLASTTKINHTLTPGTTNYISLGSSSYAWKNFYLGGTLYLYNHKFLSNPGSDNNFFGTDAGKSITSGTNNTAAGANALYSITTGAYNTAVGDEALYNNVTGWENTAIGKGSLFSNTGYYNTASGYAALNANTDGDYNTAYGVSALVRNTSANYNTALGADAMYSNSTGIDNTATGSYALFNNTGSYNTGLGFYTLEATTGAQYNTAVGFEAGDSYDNGYNNVFVGANTDVSGAGYYNVIAIGQGTICTGSSQVTVGNGATAEYRAYANWSNISDGRFKKNIQQNVPGLTFINKLQPVTYTLDATGLDNFLHKDQAKNKQISTEAKTAMSNALAEKEKVLYTGFVAQDVEKAAKSLNYDFSGVDAAKNDKDVYGLRYAEFVVPLVKAVQELSTQNDLLKSKNDELEERLSKLEAVMNVSNQLAFVSSAFLAQNVPNPFSNSTRISYSLPQTYSSARIIITDNKGVTLKQISLNTKGKGSVQVDATTLASGAYHYSLYVDGKMIDSKQMMSSK